jgi:hypothetical protein
MARIVFSLVLFVCFLHHGWGHTAVSSKHATTGNSGTVHLVARTSTYSSQANIHHGTNKNWHQHERTPSHSSNNHGNHNVKGDSTAPIIVDKSPKTKNERNSNSNSSPATRRQYNNPNLGTFDPRELECNLCEYQYAIILATGRSGSTTLLEMINQLDGFDIGGEHDGQLNVLYDLHQVFEESKRYRHVKSQVHEGSAWYNRELPSSHFFCWAQSWFQLTSGWKPQYLPHNIHGFKEIRYNRTVVLDFIHEVFPCAKYIVNMRRDLEAQHRSFFKVNESMAQLRAHNDVLLNFVQTYPSQTYIMYLEDYDKVNLWNDLFAWLDRSNCKAKMVLHANANHSLQVDNHPAVHCD